MVRVEQFSVPSPLSRPDERRLQHSQSAARHSESVLSSALRELQQEAYTDGALRETEEDLAFALGGRIRDPRRGPGSQDGVRPRVLMQKLVDEVAAVEAVELDRLLAEPSDWMHAPHLLAALQAQTPDPGRAALQLAAWLARGRLEPRLRERLEAALAELAADDTLGLSLFGALEFGAPSAALRHELVRLYHRANARRQKLSEWFAALGEREGRKRKLRTMLRALAYDLSASGEPIVGSHLAAVIGDLKQLLRLLGLEAYCDEAAEALAVPGVHGEALLMGVVNLAEQIWVSVESVVEALPALEDTHHYRVAQALGRLVQRLPEECFEDAEQKAQLQTAIAEWRDRTAE